MTTQAKYKEMLDVAQRRLAAAMRQKNESVIPTIQEFGRLEDRLIDKVYPVIINTGPVSQAFADPYKIRQTPFFEYLKVKEIGLQRVVRDITGFQNLGVSRNPYKYHNYFSSHNDTKNLFFNHAFARQIHNIRLPQIPHPKILYATTTLDQINVWIQPTIKVKDHSWNLKKFQITWEDGTIQYYINTTEVKKEDF